MASGALLVVCCAAGAVAARANSPAVGERVTAQVIAAPHVWGPIPVTETSLPWGATDQMVEEVDLARLGYIEQEYFVSGSARVFDQSSDGQLRAFARGGYTTRILVRRPRRAGRFSGTVVVEPFNPSLRHDLPIMWGAMHGTLTRNGDVWIGVTVKPVAIESLKEFDAARYAGLGFPNPLPAEQTCSQAQLPLPRGGLPPESSPQTENGLIWDVLSQVGAAVRASPGDNARFGGLRAERVYMTGYSQSAAFVLTYANVFHAFAQRAQGGPIYDGYLAATATGSSTPIHQCAAPRAIHDPRREIGPVGVPVIVMVTQSEIAALRRRADSDAAPDLFRGYEVAGASHINAGGAASRPLPAYAGRTRGGQFDTSQACAQSAMPPNDVPFAALLSGALRNLDRWSRTGLAPPRAAPIGVSDPGKPTAQVIPNALGNATGGVRTPQVDVPLARYFHRMTGPGICELWGYRKPFDLTQLTRLYSSPENWLKRFQGEVDRMVDNRWIERADARLLVSEARMAAMH